MIPALAAAPAMSAPQPTQMALPLATKDADSDALVDEQLDAALALVTRVLSKHE